MLVSSPGAEYMASRWCDRLPLTIGKHVFPSDLIILESQGLDIILGMDWPSKYGGNIIVRVSQFYSPLWRERGSSMYPGMRQGGPK